MGAGSDMIRDEALAATTWLRSRDIETRVRGWEDHARQTRPWSSAVRVMSGYRGDTHQCPDRVRLLLQQDLEPLAQWIEREAHVRCAQAGIEAFERILGLASSPVVLLVGGFGSNALQAWTENGMAAVTCVEHGVPLQGSLALGATQISAWVVHELVHCARCSVEGFDGRMASFAGPASAFTSWLDALPLAERLVDEGIASAIQVASHPGEARAALLGFSAGEESGILAREWRLLDSLAAVEEAGTQDERHATRLALLYAGTPDSRATPARWGYLAGARLADDARRVMGSWRALVQAPAREVLEAAALARDAEGARVLRRLAGTLGGRDPGGSLD